MEAQASNFMAFTVASTLAEIISAHPALARGPEHLGLDYRYGGKRSLDKACRQLSWWIIWRGPTTATSKTRSPAWMSWLPRWSGCMATSIPS